jgi:hypothetical protein
MAEKDPMVRKSIGAAIFAVVGVVGSAAAGVHYDGIWRGVAALSAALLVFSVIHQLVLIQYQLALIQTVLIDARVDALARDSGQRGGAS